MIREGLSTTFVVPGQVAEVGALGEIVDRGSGVTMIRDLDDAASSPQRYGCDRFTATVLANRFGYVVEHMCSAAPDVGVLADPARLLRLRRDDHRAARRRATPTPAMSNSIVLFTGTMADSVRNTIEEYGARAAGAGRRHRRQRPVPDRHARQRPAVRAPRVPRRASSSRFVNLKAHQLDMGGVVPAGFSIAKQNVYENGLVLSPRALYQRRRARARDRGA